MDQSYLEQLQKFRDEVEKLDDADDKQWHQYRQNTCEHIAKCLSGGNGFSEKSLRILKDCLEKLQLGDLSFKQLRTDIIFSIDLCVHIVKGVLSSKEPED